MPITNAPGFVEPRVDVTDDLLNSLLPQWGPRSEVYDGANFLTTFRSVALSGLEGLVHIANDGENNGKISQVRGGVWVDVPTGSSIAGLTTETSITRTDYFPFEDTSNSNFSRKGLIGTLLGLTIASDITSGIFNVLRIPNLDASKITTGLFNIARIPTIPFSKGGTGQTSRAASAVALLGTHTTQLVTSTGSPGSYTPTATILVTAIVSTTGMITIVRGTDSLDVIHDPDEGQAGLVLEYNSNAALRDTVHVSAGIASITVDGGGSGYSSPPGVTIAAPPAGGVQATATAILTSGSVSSIMLTNRGSGYRTAPAVTFSSGAATATAVLADEYAILSLVS